MLLSDSFVQTLRKVQRLAQYELYFQSLLNESRQHHDYDTEELIAAKNRANQAVRRGQEESDLERIQDLFPNDCLYLYDKDVVTMKMKGLMRKRSGTASRLQRALSAKSLRHENSPPRTPAPGTDTRTFLMEAPVQFCTGVQSQDRHLFLFNDLLLVAKARSGGNFKLKEKVRVSEIWMSKSCIDEVTELSKSPDTSFALGWPTTNVVAVFSTQASRDLWWTKLNEVLVTERLKEPASTNIQVIYFDHNTNIEYCKTFMVGPEETAKGCIKAALAQLGLDGGQFQLWVKTARDEAPYPLIGHERPFAIKLSCLRDGLAAEEGFDLDHCNNIHDPLARCHFILRIMEGDTIPKPVAAMLQQIFNKGPFTQGIFRKSANARLVRELKEKLDLGEDVSFEHVPVLVSAALFKEFLRSLPDPLLTSALYPQYRAALNSPNTHHKLLRLKGVLQQLPKANYILLSHFLCVLHHISRRSAHNLMSSSNLGVCVGPSLIWGSNPSIAEDLRLMPALVDCLITNCEVLLGPHVSHLLGDPRDSGTEESDSLRRDDSSIDSLECSPPPRKDGISTSRDSGLTMSDSQLYTPDEEESGSTSSSGYDHSTHPHPLHTPRPHYEVTPSLSMPSTGEYVRVYGGWEERLNPNFSRQAWFRQRSRRINTKPDHQVQRCASEESLLDNPPPTPPRRNKPQPPTPLTPKSSFVLSKYSTPPTSQHPTSPPYDLYVNTPVPSYSTTDLYQPVFNTTHPPLRKVTAVHCEITPDRTKDCGSPDDSSTLSDDDCTPHVSRSNSRGNEVSTSKLRHLPPVHVETCYVRGRLKRKEERAAHRSRSLPPPPPYRPPPPASTLRYNIARAYMDEESYV
ncbi:hypothetical protein M8J75_010502 [Diaphorina citri]|nr:hypothetical protein M8J75_010502 [Diaphorina citri]